MELKTKLSWIKDFLFKKDRNLLKNPIIYIGLIVIIVLYYFLTCPTLGKYVFIDGKDYKDWTAHTTIKCSEIKGGVERVDYKEVNLENVKLCTKCMTESIMDKIIQENK